MPETIRQKMIRQERLRPNGTNWRGSQVAFFNLSGSEWPNGMTPKEEDRYIYENWPESRWG